MSDESSQVIIIIIIIKLTIISPGYENKNWDEETKVKAPE